MQLRTDKPKTRYERWRAKRNRDELRAIPVVFVVFFAIALTAEYENPLILFAVAIACALRILTWGWS
jgi:hypothetical protein